MSVNIKIIELINHKFFYLKLTFLEVKTLMEVFHEDVKVKCEATSVLFLNLF
jgi:hypothetical protein